MVNIIEKKPTLGFSEAVKTASGKLTQFNGRARRSELWWFYLLCMIVNLVIELLPLGYMMQSIIGILVLVFLSAVTVRRLHDRGQSGWWVFVSILTYVIAAGWLQSSGLYEELSTINPDPEKIAAAMQKPFFLITSLVNIVSNIIILIFCLCDGKPETNKYGQSPKYVIEDTETAM